MVRFPPALSTTLTNLLNLGFTIDDAKCVTILDVFAGVNATQEGPIDATTAAVGMEAIAEADMRVGMRFLRNSMDPILSTSLMIFGLILALAGFVGCILPILPGPPLGFIALLILSLARDWEPFSVTFLALMGGLTLLITIVDYLVPVAGAKKYGASRWGVWGSLIGLLVGFFVFPPFGMFAGGFVGAVAGELSAGREGRKALRAGLGAFLGNLLGIGLKLALSGVMLFFYIKHMF